MTQKLALYFLSQDSASRVLDAEHQPLHGKTYGWTVGRLPTCDISWSVARNPAYAMVSKRHALITATLEQDTTEGGTPIYHWAVIDHGDKGRGSTNGTYLSQDGRPPYRLQAGVAYEIRDGDRLQFGCKAALVKCSFDIDDTQGCAADDTDPATLIEAAGAAGAEVTGRTMADVAAMVLNGPEGIDKRLWWAFCAAGALGVVLLLER